MIFAKGACWVETVHRPLFWETCHALENEPSKKIAAIGEKITGGRFSYIKVFQKAGQENSTGVWNSSGGLS